MLAASIAEDSNGISGNTACKGIAQVLKRLGFEVDYYHPADVPASDETIYDACIIPRTYAFSPFSQSDWANGGKSYPVLLVYDDTVEKTGWSSGLASRTTGLTDETAVTTPDGDTVYFDTFSTGVLKSETGLTALMTVDGGTYDGQVICWKDERAKTALGADAGGASGSFVMRGMSTSTWLPQLLLFLNHAGLIAPTPQIYYIDFDDISGYVGDGVTGNTIASLDGYATGLAALQSWALAQDTIILGGLITSDITSLNTAAELDGVLEILQDTDAFAHIMHDHTDDYWRTDTTYTTTALKIAKHDANIALWAAVGITANRGSYYGYSYLPWNAASTLGLQAMTRIGLTALRMSSLGTPGAAPCINSITRPIVDEDETVRQLAYRTMTSVMDYDTSLWTTTYWSGSDTAAKRYTWQQDEVTKQFFYPQQHISFHPMNFMPNADATETMPGLQMLNELFLPYVRLAGSSIARFATATDWQTVGQVRRRPG